MAHPRLSLLFVIAFEAMADKHPKAAPVDPSKKVRVFVGESEAFFASSFGTASANTKSANAVQSSSAGIEKMTVLVMKALNDRCQRS